jgi:diphthamide biosynthesis protein 2
MTAVTAPLPLSDDHPDELLSRTITPPIQTQELSIEEGYEIERTVQLLREGGFRQIALQFPDDLLHDAAEVSRRLQQGVEGAKTYILADTSYGRYLKFTEGG